MSRYLDVSKGWSWEDRLAQFCDKLDALVEALPAEVSQWPGARTRDGARPGCLLQEGCDELGIPWPIGTGILSTAEALDISDDHTWEIANAYDGRDRTAIRYAIAKARLAPRFERSYKLSERRRADQ